MINSNEEKNPHFSESGIEPNTLQISQKQGKLDLYAITIDIVPSRLLVQE